MAPGMSEPERQTDGSDAGASAPRPPGSRAFVTWIVAAVSLLVFVAPKLGPVWTGGVARLAPRGWSVYLGAYYSLVTSVFVHGGAWHLAVSLGSLCFVGRTLERRIGSWRYLGFFVVAAWVSSACELAVTGDTAIGLSGVVYAVVGFLWFAPPAVAQFQRVVDRMAVALFLILGVLCLVAPNSHVANAAHVGGLVFGGLIGAALRPRWRRVAIPAAALLPVLATVSLFWAPWSTTWLSTQASQAAEAGDRARTVDYYSRKIALDPDNAWAYVQRAWAHTRLEEWEAAAADLDRALALDPGSNKAHALRGWVRSKLGDDAGALADYRRAIEIDVNDHWALNNAAWILVSAADPKLHDFELAVRLARRAVGRAPENGYYLGTLGVALYRAGKWREARDTLALSMAAGEGGEACRWLFAAMADFRLGEEAEARDEFAQATGWLDAHPGDRTRFLDDACREAAALLGERR